MISVLLEKQRATSKENNKNLDEVFALLKNLVEIFGNKKLDPKRKYTDIFFCFIQLGELLETLENIEKKVIVPFYTHDKHDKKKSQQQTSFFNHNCEACKKNLEKENSLHITAFADLNFLETINIQEFIQEFQLVFHCWQYEPETERYNRIRQNVKSKKDLPKSIRHRVHRGINFFIFYWTIHLYKNASKNLLKLNERKKNLLLVIQDFFSFDSSLALKKLKISNENLLILVIEQVAQRSSFSYEQVKNALEIQKKDKKKQNADQKLRQVNTCGQAIASIDTRAGKVVKGFLITGIYVFGVYVGLACGLSTGLVFVSVASPFAITCAVVFGIAGFHANTGFFISSLQSIFLQIRGGTLFKFYDDSGTIIKLSLVQKSLLILFGLMSSCYGITTTFGLFKVFLAFTIITFSLLASILFAMCVGVAIGLIMFMALSKTVPTLSWCGLKDSAKNFFNSLTTVKGGIKLCLSVVMLIGLLFDTCIGFPVLNSAVGIAGAWIITLVGVLTQIPFSMQAIENIFLFSLQFYKNVKENCQMICNPSEEERKTRSFFRFLKGLANIFFLGKVSICKTINIIINAVGNGYLDGKNSPGNFNSTIIIVSSASAAFNSACANLNGADSVDREKMNKLIADKIRFFNAVEEKNDNNSKSIDNNSSVNCIAASA